MAKLAAPPRVKIAAGSGGGVGAGVAGGVAPPPPPTINAIHGVVAQTVASPQVPDQKPTGERAVLESKLSLILLDKFDCWKKLGSDCKLAEDGSVEIQLFLTDDSPAVIRQIEGLGFSVSQDRALRKMVIGRIPLEKLAELANVQMVRFITLVRR